MGLLRCRIFKASFLLEFHTPPALKYQLSGFFFRLFLALLPLVLVSSLAILHHFGLSPKEADVDPAGKMFLKLLQDKTVKGEKTPGASSSSKQTMLKSPPSTLLSSASTK